MVCFAADRSLEAKTKHFALTFDMTFMVPGGPKCVHTESQLMERYALQCDRDIKNVILSSSWSQGLHFIQGGQKIQESY